MISIHEANGRVREVVDLAVRTATKTRDATLAIRAAEEKLGDVEGVVFLEGARTLLAESIALEEELKQKNEALLAEFIDLERAWQRG